MKIDLHVHSVYSDGTLTPEEIVDICVNDKIDAIAITDHDNVLAIPIATELGKSKGVEIIPGVEINTMYKDYEVHVLGYFMDIEDDIFLEVIEAQQQARYQQLEEMVSQLNNLARIPIKMSDVEALTIKGGSLGRPHLAKAIVDKGGAGSLLEAYNKFITPTSSTYVRRKSVTPHEAVEAVYEARGIPVIAHPKDMADAESLIKDLMNYGLRGLEVYHKSHSPALVEYHSTLAEKYGLIITGGSDCHGPRGTLQYSLGKNLVPDWVLSELKKEKQRLDQASYKTN